MRYLPHTPEDVARMLGVIGAPSIDALFAHIPEGLRARGALDLGPGLDEATLMAHVGSMGAKSRAALSVGTTSFLGGGLTPHHIPTAVDAQLARAEWYTSYTPYQPEISQGTLQAVYEFQTIVAEIFGLGIANASMYDGSTATAEALLMARRVADDQKSAKSHSVLSAGLHPQYRTVCATYMAGLHAAAEEVLPIAALDETTGRTTPAAVEAAIAEAKGPVACVVVQSPNYWGVVEDVAALSAVAHKHGALLVTVTTEPLSCGVLQPPGALGADIAIGEGLGLGFGPQLGGPGVGMFAARQEHLRAMPGRLVGETVDKDGHPGFVLTLATREQHIRREKATSNICTNTGLMALAFTVHLSLLGKRGFRELARLNLAKAEYAKKTLAALPGFGPKYSGPTYNEFALKVRGGDAAGIVETLAGQGIFAGVPGTGNDSATLLVAVTELHSRSDIDKLAQSLEEVTR